MKPNVENRQRAPFQLGGEAGDQRAGGQAVPFLNVEAGDAAGDLEGQVALLVFDDPLRTFLDAPAAAARPYRQHQAQREPPA